MFLFMSSPMQLNHSSDRIEHIAMESFFETA